MAATLLDPKCKEQECPEQVVYEPQIVRGLVRPPKGEPKPKHTVYLTCARGHTHPYQIQE